MLCDTFLVSLAVSSARACPRFLAVARFSWKATMEKRAGTFNDCSNGRAIEGHEVLTSCLSKYRRSAGLAVISEI